MGCKEDTSASVFLQFTLYLAKSLGQLALVSTSLYILHYPYKCFCSRNFCQSKRGRRFFWDAKQLSINASQHPRAKASCFWLSALHFLCWKIFKVSLLINTSLILCQIMTRAPSCQQYTFCDSRYLLSPYPCQQFTLHTAKSSQVSCLSAIWSTDCKSLLVSY